MDAIDMVVLTKRYMNGKASDWTVLDEEQAEMIRWVMADG